MKKNGGYRCHFPGCGYEFPGKVSDICPNCGNSPLPSEDYRYSREEIEGRKILCELALIRLGTNSLW